MAPVSRSFLTRAAHAVADLGIDLEPTQCHVEDTCRSDGKRVFHLAVRTVPATPEARSLMASAAQVAIHEEFADLSETLRLDVHVTVPAALVRHSETAALWIERQAEGMHDFWKAALRVHIEAACAHVLGAYPWRDKVAMTARIPLVVQDAFAHSDTFTFFDPALLDTFLPMLDAHLHPAHRMTVLADATKHRGAPLVTVLDLYEHVYDLVASGRGVVHVPTRHLFHAIFDASASPLT